MAASLSPQEVIAQKRNNELDAFIGTLGKSNAFESLTAVTAHVSSEYRRRTLIELIQNGYDPHPPHRKNGEIAILLDETEGEFGCLYVANRGKGFTQADFESLCDIARSQKIVNQGIGNKGLGFRSVLEASRLPQIFSRNSRNHSSDDFDGFCFTFPTDNTLKKILKGTNKQKHLSDIIKKVPRLLLPVNIPDRPGHVPDFAKRRFATVVRMPLNNRDAMQTIREQIEEISNHVLPVQLFLERLEKIEIKVISADSEESENTKVTQELVRNTVTRWSENDIKFQRIDIGDGEEYLVIHRDIADEEFRQVLNKGIESEQLPRDWKEWKEQARISVAVPLGNSIENGRIYNFLPMGEKARSPIGGHLNAPFLSKMDRTDLEGDIALNEFFIEKMAVLCLEAAQSLREKKYTFVPSAVVDLTMWKGNYEEVIDGLAAQSLGTTIEKAPLISPLPLTANGKRRWESLDNSRIWEGSEECSVLTPERIAKDASAILVDPELGKTRINRLHSVATRLLGSDLDPSSDKIAGWAEALASRLQNKHAKISTWNSFYEDLHELFRFDSEALAGRKILLTQNQALAVAGQLELSGEDDAPKRRVRKRRTSVFFPPVRGTEDDEGIDDEALINEADEETEEDDETSELALKDLLEKLSPALKRRIRFLNPELACTKRRDPSGVREFLQVNRLVSEYETRDIQRLLANATALPGDAKKPDGLRKEALRFAFAISSKGEHIADLSEMPFYVPTASGWRPAREAYFGHGWRDTKGDDLRELAEAVAKKSDEIAEIRKAMIPPFRSWPIHDGKLEEWRTFLRATGVKDVLRPKNALGRGAWKQEGHLLSGELQKRCDVEALASDLWMEELHPLASGILNPNTAYTVRGRIIRLPGQNDFEEFSNHAKRLYARQFLLALGEYGPEILSFQVYRPGHYEKNTQDWPSPFAVFLREAEWLPVNSNQENLVLSKPKNAWHFSRLPSNVHPEFLPMVENEIRSILEASETILNLMQEHFGLNIVNTSQSAPHQVTRLGNLAADGFISAEDSAAFDILYTEGWNFLLKSPEAMDDTLSSSPLCLAAHCGDEIIGISVRDEEEEVDEDNEIDDSDDDLLPIKKVHVDDGHEPLNRDLLKELGYPIFDFKIEHPERLADRLSESFPNVTKVSDVAIEILADGKPFKTSDQREHLIGSTRRWLLETILLTSELSSPFMRGGMRWHDEMRTRLERLRFEFVGDIKVRISDKTSSLPPFAQGCFLYRDDVAPTILLETTDDELSWPALQQMSHAIAEAAGHPHHLSSALGDVFAQMSRRHEPDLLKPPTEEDYEFVCRTNRSTLQAARRRLRHLIQHLIEIVTPVVFTCLGEARCNEFRGNVEDINSEIELELLLTSCADQLDIPLERLIAACRQADSPNDIRRDLNLDLSSFNEALVALGRPYQKLNFAGEHQSQFETFCADQKQDLCEALRSAYVGDFDEFRSLETYIQARKLVGLEADETWATQYEELTDELMSSQLDNWLATHNAKQVNTQKVFDEIQIGEAREHNLQYLRTFATEAWPIIFAWCDANSVSSPVIWSEGDSAVRELGVHASETGWLDFRTLDQTTIIEWLKQDALWPEGMPVTLELTDLSISPQDIERGQKKGDEEKREKDRRDSTIDAAGYELSVDQINLPERLDEIVQTLADNEALWSTRVRITSLIEMPQKGKPGGGGGKASHARKKVPEKKLEAIGLLGERIAYEWLKKKYPDHVGEENWVSVNRSLGLGIGGGDDTLGYDFQVTVGKITHHFEVKATTGDDTFFRLGPTEVEAAFRMRSDRQKQLRILFIRWVTNPERTTIDVLPNPYSKIGRGRYRVVSQGKTGLAFEFPKSK